MRTVRGLAQKRQRPSSWTTCPSLRLTAIGAITPGTRPSHVRTSPMRLGFGSMKSLTIRPHGRSWKQSCKTLRPRQIHHSWHQVSAALTRSAKGDLATKIHNFKDEKSKNGIQVRGRRVLLMLVDYFRTSEEAGSLYRVEDLLGVVRTGESVEDLRRFLNWWDATIAGMETPPDDFRM